MPDTEHKLSELMHRATASLESDTTTLVQRGMRRGSRLRRRRTAGVAAAAAFTAAALTGGVVVAASSLDPDRSEGFQPAGTPTLPARTPRPSPAASPSAARPLSAKALITLRQRVPSHWTISDPQTWGDQGFAAASVVVDDGKGASRLSVLVERRHPVERCPAPVTEAGYCKKRDGFVIFYRELDVLSPAEGSARAVTSNYVALHRPDGAVIYLTSYNAHDEKNNPATRPRPPFSVSQLTGMARSTKWTAAVPSVVTK